MGYLHHPSKPDCSARLPTIVGYSVLGGIFSIIFGVVLIAYPVPGVMALVWLIGAYALVFGLTMIVLAFLLRSLPKKLEIRS